MSKKLQLKQGLHSKFKTSFAKSSIQRLGILFASSAFLVLALPTINLPGSKLLAQNAVSQDLDAAILYQLGVTRYNRRDFKSAESAFRQALQRDSNIGLARNYLGNIFLEQNRLDLAVQEYGEAIRLIPNFGEAYYNLGLALHRQGQKEAAITAYRQALAANPKMAAAQYNLGLALYEQEQRQEAIAAYQQAINLDGNNANAYFNLAIALQQEGQVEQAIAAYRQTVKLNPEKTAAYNNLGALLVLQDQPAEAIKVYQQAIRQNSKNAVAYYNLGVILYNQGDLKTANSAFKRARQEYGEQGNTEQTAKIDEMTQKITEHLTPKKSQPTQTTTPTPNNSDVVLPTPEMQTPEVEKNSTDVPKTVEPKP